MLWLMEVSEEKSISRKARRFSSVFSTLILCSLFPMVPTDSSAARIPFPEATIRWAMSERAFFCSGDSAGNWWVMVTYLLVDSASAAPSFWWGGCRQRDPALPVTNFYKILDRCGFFSSFFFTPFFSLLSRLVGECHCTGSLIGSQTTHTQPIIGPICSPYFSAHFSSPVYITQFMMLWNWDFSNFFSSYSSF